ncbi:hypothetical protein [Photorhabdus temperata]
MMPVNIMEHLMFQPNNHVNPLINIQTTNIQSGQSLQPPFSGVQKEKDSTANTTLKIISFLLREANQRINDASNLRNEVNQLVNLPSFRGAVNRGNEIYSVNQTTNCWLVQELDSIPLACNSLRIMRFIHAETEASPSWANAAFIPCSRDGSTLNAICLFPFPDILMVDTWFTPVYIAFVYQVYDKCEPKTTPRSKANTIEASNQQPLIQVTIMAIQQHNQTRLKFTFLIASSNQRLVDSENEASLLVGKSNLVFVSRHPKFVMALITSSLCQLSVSPKNTPAQGELNYV